MTTSALRIVADENIPELESYFGHLGDIKRLAGREMTAADVRDADALIVRSVTKVDANLLAGSRVKFVGTCTIGVDHLDQAFLEQAEIAWANAPGCNANSVVEYVFCALAALGKYWQGKTVGIVGCGNVGGLLYRRLSGMGIKCRVYDPFLGVDACADLHSLEEVLACDIVSLHAPLTVDGPHPSRHLINADNLPLLKEGAVLLSCGRGAVIDHGALLAFLPDRKDLSCVLDVWEPEPALNPAVLAMVEIASPHIAGYSYDGKVTGTQMIATALHRAFELEAPVDGDQGVEQLQLIEARGSDIQSVLFQVLLQAYDIKRDDADLRAVALDGKPMGGRFDALRKHYPKRLEFRHFTVDTSALDDNIRPEMMAQLQTLGFKLKS